MRRAEHAQSAGERRASCRARGHASVRAAAKALKGIRQPRQELRASTCPQCVAVASVLAQTAGVSHLTLAVCVLQHPLSRSHSVPWLLSPCVGVLLFCAALEAQESKLLHSPSAPQGAAVEAAMSAAPHTSNVALSASVAAPVGESSHANAQRLPSGIPEALGSPEPSMLLLVGALFCWLAFARRRSAHAPR